FSARRARSPSKCGRALPSSPPWSWAALTDGARARPVFPPTASRASSSIAMTCAFTGATNASWSNPSTKAKPFSTPWSRRWRLLPPEARSSGGFLPPEEISGHAQGEQNDGHLQVLKSAGVAEGGPHRIQDDGRGRCHKDDRRDRVAGNTVG